ncbi:MAG: universal stress protein [Planctomycetota bacterium]|nr:MAG: universal stress protein [Planctomycetota bacterium]REJ96481.1 MAG: universal stress protein [Planctomycetota bacterium]REK25125.1 MAG: universal stress protein [Planctomycetota bacterium]REK40517.1 MAG: universal stress protein [Planctomycetota bacterium]
MCDTARREDGQARESRLRTAPDGRNGLALKLHPYLDNLLSKDGGQEMKLKCILCPVDFSKSSKAALDYAAALARESEARLVLLHVVENPLAYDTTFSGPAPTEKEMQEAEHEFADMLEGLGDIATEHRTVLGDPAACVVQAAEEDSADLVVVGTHGRTGLSRLLMGSVAEEVVRKAPCPVIAVKQPPDDA